MTEKSKSRTINGVSAHAANKLARAAADEIAALQAVERESFYDTAASCEEMIEKVVTLQGESARESTERVAAGLLRVKFGGYDGDQPGVRLQKDKPGEFRVHTHRREAPSLRSIIRANKEREERNKRERLKQGVDEVTTEP